MTWTFSDPLGMTDRNPEFARSPIVCCPQLVPNFGHPIPQRSSDNCLQRGRLAVFDSVAHR